MVDNQLSRAIPTLMLKPEPLRTILPFRKTAVLIHGMLSSDRSMRRLGDALQSHGIEPVYWSYPTMRRSLLVHGENLSGFIKELRRDRDGGPIDFVAHSMGGIILRIALRQVAPADRVRIVMLAPPNSGSRLTRFLVGPIGDWFPQLPELGESPTSLVNQLPDPVADVGILAAARDRVVDLAATHLLSEQDHHVISTTHQRLPAHPEAVHQACHFLEHGCFERPGDASKLLAA